MRILIIQDQLRIGGTERQSLLMGADLRQAGHDPVLLLFRPGGQLYGESQKCDFPVHVLQRCDSGVSLWAPGLKKAVGSIRPEIMICMGRTANCYAGHLQGNFPSIPVVATVRTGKHLLPFHTSSLNKAASVIVNCNWWKRELVKRQISPDKVHVIHNASLVDARQYHREPARSDLRELHGAGNETCVFLNVATFRPGKRHRDLLAAFHALAIANPQTDWQLWLAGSGRTLEKCRNWCTARGLDSRVRFLGYQADPVPCYAAADVAVSVSVEDSLPNFLIEAQMLGLPVIARDFRGVQETFEPGRSGILTKTNAPTMLVPLLKQMATDSSLRLGYSTFAADFASARFDRVQQGKKLMRLLGNLVNSGN